jgi:hypothetical protein
MGSIGTKTEQVLNLIGFDWATYSAVLEALKSATGRSGYSIVLSLRALRRRGAIETTRPLRGAPAKVRRCPPSGRP